MALLFGPGYVLLRVASLPGPVGARRAERAWMRLTTRLLGVQVQASGLAHARTGGPFVVVALHEGFADALALARLPLPLTYIARDELERWRLLGGQLRRGGHVIVAPEASWTAARDVIGRARAALERGESVVVFPQGSVLGLEVAFQPAAATLVRALGRPVLPVVLTGAHRVWEHPFSPTLRFGQSVALQILSPVPALQASEGWRELEASMKRLALEASVRPRRFDPERDGFWDGYRFDIDPSFADVARLLEARRAAPPLETRA